MGERILFLVWIYVSMRVLGCFIGVFTLYEGFLGVFGLKIAFLDKNTFFK
jgi:hypothetical protein